MSNFDYSKYDPEAGVVFYQPYGTPGANRQAINPLTGQTLARRLHRRDRARRRQYQQRHGRSKARTACPLGLIQDRGAHWGPRLGIAYQINSKTVFRTGGGVFYERVATFGPGITSNYTTNPPSLRTATLYYGNVANIASTPGTFFPAAINRLSSDGHVPTVYNYNVGHPARTALEALRRSLVRRRPVAAPVAGAAVQLRAVRKRLAACTRRIRPLRPSSTVPPTSR